MLRVNTNSYPVQSGRVGTLRSEDGDGRENVTKSEFALFQSSLRLLQVTNFVSQVQKEGGNFVGACVLPLCDVKLGIFK